MKKIFGRNLSEFDSDVVCPSWPFRTQNFACWFWIGWAVKLINHWAMCKSALNIEVALPVSAFLLPFFNPHRPKALQIHELFSIFGIESGRSRPHLEATRANATRDLSKWWTTATPSTLRPKTFESPPKHVPSKIANCSRRIRWTKSCMPSKYLGTSTKAFGTSDWQIRSYNFVERHLDSHKVSN